jgi:quinolinate synthase
MTGSQPFISLAELEATAVPTTYGPGASTGVAPPRRAAMASQAALPEEYRRMSEVELADRIEQARQTLGRRLVILGHHYQRDQIIVHSDFRGDSFALSQQAAMQDDAEFIVFCGVHFMAESADILSGDQQTVILPNLTAGCSMADMANSSDVRAAWNSLSSAFGADIIPVTYMNSSAELKAFCGEHGGIVCTSSNAARAITWAFEGGSRVLFFPDEHLGRNTADLLGIDQARVSVWNPRAALESLKLAVDASIIVWKGFCSVHERFTVEQIENARREHPGCHVIVHPECHRSVVQSADASGSTERIVALIESAPAGSVIAVGTEINLVNRLAQQHPDKSIFCLDSVVCPCSTMYRIHPAYLAWVLDHLIAGKVVNRVSVDGRTKTLAHLALERMLALPPTGHP